MKISSKELEASKVRVIVDKNPVATSFEKWEGSVDYLISQLGFVRNSN